MARIAKDVILKREAFVRDFFNKNPEGTVESVNEQLAASFGKKMRPVRVHELRSEVSGKPAAKRKPGRPPGSGKKVPQVVGTSEVQPVTV